MDKIVKLNRLSKMRSRPVGAKTFQRPPREAAEDAGRTLIRWSGDDPDREGLIGTPARIVRSLDRAAALVTSCFGASLLFSGKLCEQLLSFEQQSLRASYQP
jgi:hypothetical protein